MYNLSLIILNMNLHEFFDIYLNLPEFPFIYQNLHEFT